MLHGLFLAWLSSLISSEHQIARLPKRDFGSAPQAAAARPDADVIDILRESIRMMVQLSQVLHSTRCVVWAYGSHVHNPTSRQ